MFPPSSTPSRARRALPWLAGLLLLAGLGIGAWRLAGGRAAARVLPPVLLAALGMPPIGHERRGKPNRLIHEKSPYLLQHAYNPVDWRPWGEAAFAEAEREGKPVFLSIGYSTCHWCHVMERESFEDEAVAAVLNRDFVCIKVDREERPDVDRVYMTAMQAMGTGGGWPLNVFLTPDRHPFFGGTYFPPHTLGGRVGLVELAGRVHEAWHAQRADLEANGRHVFDALATLGENEAGAGGESIARAGLFDSCAAALARSYDAEAGGFGTAPKFPSIVNLDFLMRRWASDPAGHADARAMAVRQLEAMAAGGIHDQLGGGFHRYSTDRVWLAPHFEKMLYDQAQIAWAYLEGYQVTGRPEFAAVARDVFAYVGRDLTSPEGAFWSAEDADSEGEEGRFYVWTPAGLEAALPKEDAALIADAYDVTAHGNFEHGTSILRRVRTDEEVGRRHGIAAAEASRRLAHARGVLLAARGRRVRPHRDDKVLAAWNGLMIASLARGARALNEPALAAQAARAAEFVWLRLYDPATGALARRYRDGEVAGAGQLDDYAAFAFGLVDLYQATLDPLWLERAVAVTDAMVARFYDDAGGAFFESPAGDPLLPLRMKDDFDGAEIAGNSLAASVLQQLAELLDRADWREKARQTLDTYAQRLKTHPVAMPRMLVAMDLAGSAPRHIVIAGEPGAEDTQAMLHEFNRRFLPHDQLLLVAPGEGARRLAKLVPFTAALSPVNGRATAYVCVHYACRLPTTDPAAFAAQLDERAPIAHHAGGAR